MFSFTASTISDPKVILVGASGGVYALIFAHLANVMLNWAEMKNAVLRLTLLIVFSVADTANAMYYRYIATSKQKVSYAAHFAGAIVGVLMGALVLKNLKLLKWESVAWWASLAMLIGLSLVVFIANAALPEDT